MEVSMKNDIKANLAPLLKYGLPGLLALVLLGLGWMAFTEGLEVQIKTGPSSTRPADAAAFR